MAPAKLAILRSVKCFFLALLIAGSLATSAHAQQQSFTWQQVRDKFEARNPTLLADKFNIDESKAQEITAFLRPNPTFALSADGTQIAPDKGVWRPFAGTFESPSFSYLHERQHKRELRLESAKKGTLIAESSHADLEGTLLFNLRGAFVSTLQAKAVLQLANDNLVYYDHVLQVSRDRFNAGDIAQIDLDRLELQRVQYESDVQTAAVSLRTAKIVLLTLLNDRTPIEQFDVAGPFDFNDQLMARDEFRKIALDRRPDLKAAVEAVDKAQTDHKLAVANGSTDPTLSAWYTHNSSNNNPFGINTLGVSVTIPLRIFDRNQGEQLRTQLDVTRNERLRDAASSDRGLHWTDIGEIIRFNMPFSYKGQSAPGAIGDPPLVVSPDGKYFYVYFLDWLKSGANTTASIARAPIAEVLQDAFGGGVHFAAPFKKYFQGKWDQPGIGGASTDLIPEGHFGGGNNVAYNSYIHRYMMLNSDSQNYSYAESPDGLHWTDTIFLGMLGHVPNIAGYSGPIGLGDDPTVLGKEFYVYYTEFRGPWPGAQSVKRFTLSCR